VPSRESSAGVVSSDLRGVSLRSEKVTAQHQQRLAIVYVRQSTQQPVLEHRESTVRQYALVDRAVALGWPRSAVLVIDEDQGRSGSSAEGRHGFQFVIDPDEQVQSVVKLIFEQFVRRGSVQGLLRWLVQQDVKLPIRPHQGPNRGQLEWRRPTRVTWLNMLHHRTVLQGAEIDARVPSPPVPEIHSGRMLGPTGPGHGSVPGMAPRQAMAPPRPDAGAETLLAQPTDFRPVPSRPPNGGTPRTDLRRRTIATTP